MEITIENVSYQPEIHLYEVEFSSPIGNGKGTWSSNSIPVVSQHYHVELDTSEDLVWGSSIYRVESTDMLICHDGSTTFIRGQLVDIYPEGNISLRLHDSLETFRTQGQPMPAETFVEIKTKNLKLYDMNL